MSFAFLIHWPWLKWSPGDKRVPVCRKQNRIVFDASLGNQRGIFFAPIRLHRTLKKSKRTVGSPARTTKVRLRGQRETGGFLLNLLCKDERPDVPWKLNTHSSGTFLFGRAFDCTPWSPSGWQRFRRSKCRIATGGGVKARQGQWYFRNSRSGHKEGGMVKFQWSSEAYCRLWEILHLWGDKKKYRETIFSESTAGCYISMIPGRLYPYQCMEIGDNSKWKITGSKVFWLTYPVQGGL